MPTIDHSTTDALVTPYESWCEARGVHPEYPGAYAYYTATLDGVTT